jgi:hypothetical protein
LNKVPEEPQSELISERGGSYKIEASADTREKLPAREITNCKTDILTFQVNRAVEESWRFHNINLAHSHMVQQQV